MIFNQSSPLSETADFSVKRFALVYGSKTRKKGEGEVEKRDQKGGESMSERISIFPLPPGSSE